MSIHLTHNHPFMNRGIDFIHNVHEQGLSTFKKVRSFSESYMVSYLSKALAASIALSYLGFSFSTVFPVSLALIVFINLMSFALDSVKGAIHALAQKSKACLTRIAQVISDIFAKICALVSSFAWQAIDLREKALSSTFEKKLPINYAVVTDNEAFSEETISDLAFFCPQSYVALEKNADLASITEAPQIQENTQTVTFAALQRETPEVKKSEILSKFEQLCAFSGSVQAFNYPSSIQTFNYSSFQQLQNQYKPLQLTTFPINTMPRITLPKPDDRSLEIQRLLPSPTLSPSSVKFGMKALHLVKKLIK